MTGAQRPETGVGVLVDHELRALAASGHIMVAQGDVNKADQQSNGLDDYGLAPGQVQPASLDLRLGQVAYRVQAGVLPGSGKTIKERLQPLVMAEMDLCTPQMLERGAVYVVPLQEGLQLPAEVHGTVSPKSSTGRLDIFVRLVTDGASTYDSVAAGYSGPMYLEIMPLTFPVMVRAGERLTQLRLRRGNPMLNDAEVVDEHVKAPLSIMPNGEPDTPAHVAEGLWMSIDLKGTWSKEANPVVGYQALHHTQPVDLAKIGGHGWADFWRPIRRDDCMPLILQPGEFYIFVSRERLCVPAHLSAELIAYDTRIGELRVHYAGFFDPGWGYEADGTLSGTPAVLEVRAHDVPFVLEHGQRIGRFVYEWLNQLPEQLYGQGIKSNYAGQGLKLAKQFKMS